MDNAKAKSVYDSPLRPDTPITLDDIQRTKAVIAQAEVVLGVAPPKKEAPVPTLLLEELAAHLARCPEGRPALIDR